MQCPECGYTLDAFDVTCPRCALKKRTEEEAVAKVVGATGASPEDAWSVLQASSWRVPVATHQLRQQQGQALRQQRIAAQPQAQQALGTARPTSGTQKRSTAVALIIGGLAFLAIVGGVAVPAAVRGAAKKAKNDARDSNVATLERACGLFQDATSEWPMAQEELMLSEAAGQQRFPGYKGPYISHLIKCPGCGAAYTWEPGLPDVLSLSKGRVGSVDVMCGGANVGCTGVR